MSLTPTIDAVLSHTQSVAGTGWPLIVAALSKQAQTGAVTNGINYTPPLIQATYRLSIFVIVQSWTTPATFTIVVTFKDQSGGARTETLTVMRGSTGATAAAITAADRWYAMPMLIQVANDGTAITASTSGTFSGSPTYDLVAVLERLA